MLKTNLVFKTNPVLKTNLMLKTNPVFKTNLVFKTNPMIKEYYVISIQRDFATVFKASLSVEIRSSFLIKVQGNKC